MKTQFLIDRMSIENVNKILKYTNRYPNTGESLMNELAYKEYWMKLTYDSIAILNNILDCGYTPTDISNLFKSK
jgi:hypothetical protein